MEFASSFEPGCGTCDLHACDGVAEWIGGCAVRDGLDNSRRDHIHCEECSTEGRVLLVDSVHILYGVDKGRDVDLIEIQAEDAVKISFDAGSGVAAESGRCLDVFPGDHGDILVERSEI